MIVILHVAIAISSIALTTYTFFRPSTALLRVAYALVGLTLASGTYLVWSAPSHMVETCTVGLVYLGLVSLAIVAARAKLAAQNANI